MNKFKLHIARYRGYDIIKKHFIFIEQDGYQHGLMSFEMCWGINKFLNLDGMIQYMNTKIEQPFKILSYFLDYGYYVVRQQRTNGSYMYILFDGITNERTERAYNAFEDIPKTYNQKPVYKYRKKVVLHEINGE